MKIVPIFAETLYAFQYTKDGPDEFKRLFNEWNDAELLEDFFQKNKDDLTFFDNISVEQAVIETRQDARRFEKHIEKLAKEEESPNLDSMFIELEKQNRIIALGKQKAYGTRRPNSWLRIYAIKVQPNCYVVTGGAIKLKLKMLEREHTAIELKKLERARDYLQEEGIIDKESVDDLMNELGF